MKNSTESIDARRKRLMWRASRRGIKEMDILVGGFAAEQLVLMDEAQLAVFEKLLDIPDQLLLAWLTAQEQVPAEQDCEMLRALLSFRPKVARA